MARLLTRGLLAALFLLAGVLHFWRPRLFLSIMPPVIPFPMACIAVSGVAEFLGGVGLLAPWLPIRQVAGWELALLLLAVFPANIYMALANIQISGFPAHPWMSWARLPLQPLLIWAVLWSTRALRLFAV